MADIIKVIEKPGETELAGMIKVVESCKKHDRIEYAFEIDDDFNKPGDKNIFLLYRDASLAGFISLFSASKNEVEVTAFTIPSARNTGIFRRLLEKAKYEIIRRGIPDILFAVDKESRGGRGVMEHWGIKPEYSEYSMCYNKKTLKNREKEPLFEIRESKPGDREELINLAMLAGRENRADAENYIDTIFSSGKRQQHVGICRGKIAGMISVCLEPGRFYIHGIAVHPDYRRKGFGSRLLDFKVRDCREKDPALPIELEVVTDNRTALSIYEKSGFAVAACYQYCRKAVRDLKIE